MMTSTQNAQNRNEYLDRVVAEQQAPEQNLEAKRSAPAYAQFAGAPAQAPARPSAARGRAADANIQAQFVERLPEIVEKLPKPAELRAVTIGGIDSTTLSGLVAELATVIAALRDATKRP
jgi:hypothetical protein